MDVGNNLTIQPILLQVLGEVINSQRSVIAQSRCRNVSIYLDGVTSILLITISEVIPVVKHTVVDVTPSEVNLTRSKLQSYIDRRTVLVDEANNSRKLVLIQTLRVVGSIHNFHHLIVSSLRHVAGILRNIIL